MKKRVLLWFTKDLRIHDNPMLKWANQNNCQALAVFFVNSNKSKLAFNFRLKCISEIQDKLSRTGVSSLIFDLSPTQVISKIVEQYQIDLVLTATTYNHRDLGTIQSLKNSIGSGKVKEFSSSTLFELAELPFSIENLPLVFTTFRKQIEKQCRVAPAIESSIENISGIELTQKSEYPNIAYSMASSIQDVFPFGLLPGEDAGFIHLSDYFFKSKSVLHYKDTRNGMIEKYDSSKFSIYLSQGCLSVRQIALELKNFENQVQKNESTEWLMMELIWRDYFKFLSLKIKNLLFSVNGLKSNKKWLQDEKAFANWCSGSTGIDFVDANMTELKLTGWMSNRGRQNVASYLAKHLNINWTWGAQYFENTLLDEDTESNWGNWLYVAGVGTDPRDRIFNIDRQSQMYDPDKRYQNIWLSKESRG